MFLASNFEQEFGPEKLSFQVRIFATLLQISLDWNKVSSIRKRRCKLRSLPIGTNINDLG